jgi:hypothetical protein
MRRGLINQTGNYNGIVRIEDQKSMLKRCRVKGVLRAFLEGNIGNACCRISTILDRSKEWLATCWTLLHYCKMAIDAVEQAHMGTRRPWVAEHGSGRAERRRFRLHSPPVASPASRGEAGNGT